MASTISTDTPERRSMYRTMTKAVVSLFWSQLIPGQTKDSRERQGGQASGFLMEVEGEWLWVTAGHVLKALEESFAFVAPETVGFIDDLGGTNDFPCGPFDWKSATKFYVDDDQSGVDIGFVTISQM